MRFTPYILAILAGLVLVTSAYAAPDMKADSKKPIDITADALEVQQDKQMAIFSGNVVALQGAMKLTSSVMKVYYRSGDKTKSGEQGISKIEVEGNVFLKTAEETARGQKGIYDVDKERLTLIGDVVLTHGESVVKGESLEYDVAAGRSRIIGGTSVTTQGQEAGKGGRVKGRFVPEQKGN